MFVLRQPYTPGNLPIKPLGGSLFDYGHRVIMLARPEHEVMVHDLTTQVRAGLSAPVTALYPALAK
ncbi:hypothetical protein KUTG_08998 [Kutzneria sp. 744]|nr:hypothetical protein KUTG_08998 [Kutzneria sp. 744]